MTAQEPLRFSRLKLMGRSAAHYAACEEPDTSSMEVGTAADRLVFGTGPVLAYPGAQRRGKDYDAFVERNPGALILTQKDAAKALGIADAVAACADATRLLTCGVAQQTMLWEFQGRLCRGTPDVRSESYLADLKTGETSDPRRFAWKLRTFAYHAQMAFYESGVQIKGLPPITDSYIVAVEQTPPHVVTVFRLTDRAIELGARLWRTWFEQLQICEASGEFPPYSQAIVDLDLPDDEEIPDLSDAAEVVESTR